MSRRKSYVGQRFVRLQVVQQTYWQGTAMARCRCDCGSTLTVKMCNLISGNSKSCGCLKIERFKKNRQHRTTHGDAGHGGRGAPRSGAYSSWTAMKQRCLNPKTKAYPYYGGRKITICDRWINSYENFVADMGERPDGMTIERIDVDGNYEPSNCRWATQQEQMQNTRRWRKK